ncbi:MAG: hypothetical protein ABSG31_01085 [Tepidisphaeraceae bacterium]|jgi:stress-induced morphogen
MAKGTLSSPPYVEKLTKALQKKLSGADIDHEFVRKDRYRFVVVWKKFDKMDHPERQRLVWEIAKEALPPKSLWNISMILTLGPSDLPSGE